MYKKYLNWYNILITGILILSLGIIIIILNKRFLVLTTYLISVILTLYALSSIIKLITKKFNNQKRRSIRFQIILNIIISLTFCFIPNIPLSIFSLIFGLYMIFNSIIKLVNYIIFKINNTSGRIIELIVCIFYLIFGLSCIILPLVRLDTILVIIGIYFILLGTTYISDFIKQIIPTKEKNKLKRKIKITLPVFLSVLIPHEILMQINKNLSVNNKYLKEIEKKEKPDIEIFIHVTKDGFGAAGHADLYFENEIMSYGNYDHESTKFFEAIGDGVLFIAKNKEKYLKFCIENSKKTIFGFGLKLTEKQKNAIRKQIQILKENTYEWYDPYKNKEYKKHNYYATRLYKTVKPKFYKFKKGKFKTYFVLSTNCTQLVDYIIGATGMDILKINGIITPGTYYDFLAIEYLKKNSNVISYNIYK